MNDFRAASLQSWSTVAPAWGELIDNVDRQLRLAAAWMTEAVGFEPGERVLELAGGPGTLSLMASHAVGSEGNVICTDFSEPMVDAARRRLQAHDAQNVDCRIMDAEAIDLPDGAVDVVLCRMGYMLMADPATALKETARVLDRGGRLALAVWTGPDSNPWASVPMRAILGHLGAPAPPPDAPGLWALADEGRLRGMLSDAGLDEVRIERLDDRVEYESPEAWVELTARLAGPIRMLLSDLDDEGRAAITDAVARESDRFRGEDGRLAVPEQMLAVLARRD